jgi:hypothetical protein
MAKRLTVTCLVILLASFILVVAVPAGKAETTPAKVYVDPLKVEDVALVPNTKFNVSVRIDDIPASPGLAGVQFRLTWDPNLLNCTRIQEILFHSVTPEDSWSNIWSIQLKYNNTGGYADYAQTWQDIATGIADGYAPISGNQIVANLTFNVRAVGKCALHFDPSNTILGDPHVPSQPIPQQLVDGFFSNLPPPPAPKAALLYVDPAKIVDPSLTPSHNFTINVNIINASDLAGLEFKLGFNASALHANSVASGGFIPNSVTPATQIDNTAGFIRFNVSLSTPLSGDGNVTVVQFHVEADNVRNSTLHLYDVKLVNSTGQTLPFSTVDGSFSNARMILGDLNGDGIVNLKDAMSAANAFGSSTGDPNWNPDADLDGNGKINIMDLILLATNFGRTA